MQRKTLCSLQPMKLCEIQTIFKSALSKLYDVDETTAITRTVLMEVLNYSSTNIISKQQEEISENDEMQLMQILNRLMKSEPMQYVLGYAWFCELKLKVNQHVLIPRPETEELVYWITDENKINSPSIFDIGTGSGCIAIALAKKIVGAKIMAMDVSKKALQLAEVNALTHHTKINFIEQDILRIGNSVPQNKYDIIVSNPPYVLQSEQSSMHPHVLNHEPHLALFVPDNDGLIFYKAIVEYANNNLNTNGKLYFEINEAKAEEVIQLFDDEHYKDVILKKDLQGKNRKVCAIKS